MLGKAKFVGSVICLLLTLLGSQSAQAKNGILLMPHLITPNKMKPTDLEASTKLLYYGGPVISQVKVVTVFWNDKVAPVLQKEMPQFYADFVNSSQIDWLNEYKTNVKAVDGREGTNQSFSRGSHLGQVKLVPQQRSTSITDEDVRTEIEAQVRAGVLPKPDKDTLYMIHFGREMSISIEGMKSCSSFGGYHYYGSSQELGDYFYSVLPDCAGGGNENNTLSQATFVASHELMEAVTDPYPTPGEKPAYPQAWNTSNGAEISDICGWNPGTLKGTNRSYSITRNWSNSRNSCFDGN